MQVKPWKEGIVWGVNPVDGQTYAGTLMVSHFAIEKGANALSRSLASETAALTRDLAELGVPARALHWEPMRQPYWADELEMAT